MDGSEPGSGPGRRLADGEQPVSGASLRLTHFGAAAWLITDGVTTVLFDPFFSRIRYSGKTFGTATAPVSPGDTRPVYGPNDTLVSDIGTIDAHVDRADYILISHSHFNHCMDMPHIARRTGAAVVGSESTTNIARAAGVPDDQLIPVKGGEDYEFGVLSVKVIPSLHSPLNRQRYFEPGTVPRTVRSPLRMVEYLEGGTLAYYIRFGSHRLLVFGSMNFIEREMLGLEPTIALVAAAKARLEIHDYTARLLKSTGYPALVIATHWDVQSAPYGASQAGAFEQAGTFAAEVAAASPASRVIVPRHFETVVVAPDGSASVHPAP